MQQLTRAETRIQQYYTQQNQLPDDQKGNNVLGQMTDPWGNDIRYHRLGSDRYEIVSGGMDGQFDTKDDLNVSRSTDRP